MANIANKILLSALFVILSSLPLAGCVGGSAPTQGGSGPVVVGSTIYVASRDGHIFALNPSSRKDKLDFPASGEWVFPPEGKVGLVYSAPAIDQGSLYFGTLEGKVYALDAATGRKQWEWDTPLAAKEPIIGSPVVDRQTVFVAAGSRIYALDKTSKKPVWPKPFQAEDRIWSDLVLVNETLYFGSLDHHIYAVNALTGAPRWAPLPTEGAVAGSPLIINGTLYIGSFDKGLYAVSIDSGKPRWAEPFRGNGWFWGRAVWHGGRIYVGSLDGKVYAVNLESGKLAWNEPFVASAPIRSSPVIVDGTLVVASTNGQVYGLDPETGKMRWPVPYRVGDAVYADLGAREGVVYVHAQDSLLYALEAATGRLLWTFTLKK